jgi:hypothetical protein
VIDAADVEGGDPNAFDVGEPRAIVKTVPTWPFKELSWRERKTEAEGPLRRGLEVPDHSYVRGKSILVYGCVFTEGVPYQRGRTALLRAGARDVSEVVLVRQPRPADWT